MPVGKIKLFNAQKDYGFITPDDGARTCFSIFPLSGKRV
jgi:cold shock CspA family protein